MRHLPDMGVIRLVHKTILHEVEAFGDMHIFVTICDRSGAKSIAFKFYE